MASFSDRRAVLFDLDGTLIDSCPDLCNAVGDVLQSNGLERIDVEGIRRMIGDGAPMLLERAFASRGREVPSDALRLFRLRYDERCLERTLPYPGIVDLLERLAARGDRSVGVVTNKPTTFALRVLDGLGMRHLVGPVLGPELAAARKPDADHVHATLAAMGAAAGDCVVIGDGPTDMAAGRDAGCATIAVGWGYRSREELAAEAPTAFAPTVPDLARLLLGPN